MIGYVKMILSHQRLITSINHEKLHIYWVIVKIKNIIFSFFFNFFNMIGISWFTCKGQVTCTLASNMLLLICAFNINLFLQALQRYHKQANTNHAEGLPIRINK